MTRPDGARLDGFWGHGAIRLEGAKGRGQAPCRMAVGGPSQAASLVNYTLPPGNTPARATAGPPGKRLARPTLHILYPIDPRRCRSGQRRQTLQNAARMLDAAERFERLFGVRVFPDFGTGAGFT